MVAWIKVTAVEMVRNRFWIYFEGKQDLVMNHIWGMRKREK